MAEVIDFASKRQRKKPTFDELLIDAQEQISQGWERFARANQLNDFIVQGLSVWAKEGVSYTNDLNLISEVEQQIGLNLVLTSPTEDQLGWRAGATFRNAISWTPDLPFETYARCFNVLLYLKLKKDLIAHGMMDEL